MRNNSAKTLRDVKLLVRQEWLWNDEFHPGSDGPGGTLSLTLHQDIAPHGRVDVAGFTEVGW